MIKLFISQPMATKTDEEIFKEREEAIEFVKREIDSEVELVDSYINEDLTPLQFLGRSISIMATADYVYFAPGWRKARGCLIEHECAVQYGLPHYDSK